MELGLLGLVILIADIYAIVMIVKSRATPLVKLAWSAAIIIFPLLGFIAWFFAGPGK